MDNEITDKIKKLLRLARSANEHEATLALMRAREMALKHNLSVEELDLEKDLEPIGDQLFAVGRRISFEHKMAAAFAKEYFSVGVFIDRDKGGMVIVGEAHSRLIAEYVIEFLVDRIRRGSAEFRKQEEAARRKWNNTKKANYTRGFFYALHSKFAEPIALLPEGQPETALATIDRIQRYIAEHCGKMVTRRGKPARRNRSAMAAGYDKGKQTDIRTPLQGAQPWTLQ